jgi:hypothetical protein
LFLSLENYGYFESPDSEPALFVAVAPVRVAVVAPLQQQAQEMLIVLTEKGVGAVQLTLQSTALLSFPRLSLPYILGKSSVGSSHLEDLQENFIPVIVSKYKVMSPFKRHV